MSPDIARWLEENTQKCAVGRISKAQCQANRGRPTAAEHFRGDVHAVIDEKMVYRPSECDKCEEWKALFGADAKATDRPKIKKKKPWQTLVEERAARRRDETNSTKEKIKPTTEPQRKIESGKSRAKKPSGGGNATTSTRLKVAKPPAKAPIEKDAEILRQIDGFRETLTEVPGLFVPRKKPRTRKPKEKPAPSTIAVEIDSGSYELSQRIEPAVEQPKISQPEKDKYGHPILECVDCHETQGIIGRGRCAKCYWRLPDVKSKKAKRLESKKIEGLSAESAEGAEREKKAPTTGPGRPKGAAKQSVKVSVADSPSSALSIPSVVKRRTAHNRKPPAKVLCPCGVVFEVHPPWLASVKKYHAPECRSIYGNRRVHPKFTPEQDAEIAAVYREQANTRKDQAPVRALAKKMGLPRWKVSKRAQKLGLVSVNRYSPERVWTEAEMEILKAHAGVSYERIQVKLRAAGFVRGQAAIQLKIKRTIGYKPREGYTARSLAKLFGIDDHSITAWIEKGLLKAEHRGRRRTAAQGGDQWLLQEEDVRSFVIKHVEVVDFRKLDKFWLVELLTAETEKSFTAETGKSFTAEDAEDAEKFQGLDDNPMLAVGLGPAGMTCRRCRSYVRGHKFCLEYTNSRSIVAANYRVHAEEWAACALFEFGNLTCGEIQRQEAARKAIPGAFSGHRIEEPLLGANDCGRGGLVLRKRGSAKAAGACAT